MKGFLNKVQNRVVNGKSEGAGLSPEGGKLPRGESTPRADIALPKKEKRYVII